MDPRRRQGFVVAARRIRKGEEVVEQIKTTGGEALFVQTDVAKSAEVEALVRKTVEPFGRLDWACHNAGVEGTSGSLIECSEEIGIT